MFKINHLLTQFREGIINPNIFLLLISTGITVLVLVLMTPAAQNPVYHNFADQKMYFGVQHFWNVMTNIPFLVLGMAGLIKIHKRDLPGKLHGLHAAYITFYSGLILIAFGSGYYHLNPSSSTLVWDRMAITVSFMSFFVLVVGESISTKTSAKLLLPLLLLGSASVVYWHITEKLGAGDLRLYGLVQFLPMLLIPLMLIFYGSSLSGKRWIFAILLVYAAAKIMEIYDHQIYELIGFSGHSLKHLFAACGAFIFYKTLEMRQPHRH